MSNEAVLGDEAKCSVCFSWMLGSILGCNEGHCVCEACFCELPAPKSCPSCRKAFLDPPSRQRALEGIISRRDFPCEHSCGMVGKPAEILRHLPLCVNAPVRCIFPECPNLLEPRKMAEHLRSHVFFRTLFATRTENNMYEAALSPDRKPCLELSFFDLNDIVLVYFIMFGSEDDDGVIISVKFHRETVPALLHIRACHLKQERNFALTFGSEDGECMTVTRRTESIRDHGEISPGLRCTGQLSQGFVLLEEQAKALASCDDSGEPFLRLHARFH
ncbi:unnamed protein product [Polarella glacialis]|uniref:RING-type domain-containing protein n=1 Tax=Polarella glacialis TaxID=89957 RepID=A0A813EAR0_POLGL|nr:unnamed protein product [Polarella glacialis]